jgi:hypothetical protein
MHRRVLGVWQDCVGKHTVQPGPPARRHRAGGDDGAAARDRVVPSVLYAGELADLRLRTCARAHNDTIRR